MIVTYREREYIGDYKAIDHIKHFQADSMFRDNNILYFRLDRFNIKAISLEDIILIDE